MRTAVYRQIPHQKSNDWGLPHHVPFVNPDTVRKDDFKREISDENSTEALKMFKIQTKLGWEFCRCLFQPSEMNESSVDLDNYFHLTSPAYLRCPQHQNTTPVSVSLGPQLESVQKPAVAEL